MAIDNIPIDHTLFVDPGLGGTGWAFFPQKGKPTFSGVVRPLLLPEWEQCSALVALQIEDLIQIRAVKTLAVEFPEMWGASSRSQTSADKGDLFKLSYLIGQMTMVTIAKRGLLFCNVRLFTVREWKGQLSKEIVIKRIKKRWGLSPRNHEADAIGMGLAAQGLL